MIHKRQPPLWTYPAMGINGNEAVWGGSYMDEAGRFVVLLTENPAENQEKVLSTQYWHTDHLLRNNQMAC